MRAALEYHYENADKLIPDDAQIGDTFAFTARATITEIRTTVVTDGATTACILHLDQMRVRA